MLLVTPFPFMLNFKRPAATSRGALRVREVVFLRVEQDGVVGWGECGAVPGLSRDDRPDYVEAVAAVCGQINRGADPTEADAEPWATPVAWAAKGGHREVLEVLHAHGAT